MLIVLVGREIEKAQVGYIDFGEAIENLSKRELWWKEGEVGYIGFEEAIEK